jgi:hypothetical protein
MAKTCLLLKAVPADSTGCLASNCEIYSQINDWAMTTYLQTTAFISAILGSTSKAAWVLMICGRRIQLAGQHRPLGYANKRNWVDCLFKTDTKLFILLFLGVILCNRSGLPALNPLISTFY